MKTIALLILFYLDAHSASAEAAKTPSKAARPRPKVVDLDFAADETESVAGSRSIGSPSSNGWIFWTLGATAVVGAGGYWLYESTREPTVTRSEQVFTDSPR